MQPTALTSRSAVCAPSGGPRARQPARARTSGSPRVPATRRNGATAQAVAMAPAPAAVDNGRILGVELSPNHPGFHDDAYKRRRAAIADLARRHNIGDPIPRIDYTPEEVAVWGTALRELRTLFPTAACREFLRGFDTLGFREDEIPQLQDISDVLTATSGWKVRPVAGLMHPRAFLNGFAFKHFHSTQYVRHHSQPKYTPEPDVVHELIGHVAMLANPDFARMVQAIGVASLTADEQEIKHLTKVYWHTVEFGAVREGDGVKAFGAGVLSSYGELQWFASGQAEFTPFDPYAKQPKMMHHDGFQKRYFVLNSFQDGARMLEDYARTLTLPPVLRGNPALA